MIHVTEIGINAVKHCNRSCACCNHFAPLARPWYTRPDILRRDLTALAKCLTADRFTLAGGEPLLHPRLQELINIGRASGLARRVRVLTNGYLLSMMDDCFFLSIDELCLSIYPGTPPAGEARARAKSAQFGFKLFVQEYREFCKVLTRRNLTPEEAHANYNQCPFRGPCNTIENGVLYQCPQATVLPELLFDMPNYYDGLSLHDNLTSGGITAYLNRAEPLMSCARCSHRKQFVPCHETKGREAWLREAQEC